MAPANPQLAHDLTRRALREHEADPEPAAGLRFPVARRLRFPGARRLGEQNPAAEPKRPPGPGIPRPNPTADRQLPGPTKPAAHPSARRGLTPGRRAPGPL